MRKRDSHSDICLCVTLLFMSVQGKRNKERKSMWHVNFFKCVSLIQQIMQLPHVTNLTRSVLCSKVRRQVR